MRELIHDLIPHAPKLGLYVSPNIPSDKMRNALRDYARGMTESDVLALYDATLLGSGKDGAVFAKDRLVFQNIDLGAVNEIRFQDIVKVENRRRLMGGRRVYLNVNRGRATFDLEIDFSGKPDAAEYVARFLKEVMLRESTPDSAPVTDADAVRAALEKLRERGLLTEDDLSAMLRVLGAV